MKDSEKNHASWEVHYECSNCGEFSRKPVRECPFCHAIMDAGLDPVLHKPAPDFSTHSGNAIDYPN